MDVLLALAAAVPATPPAPGKAPSSIEAPVGTAGSDFQALMAQADARPGGPAPATPFPGEPVPSSGSPAAVSGDPAAPTAHDANLPDHRPEHVLSAAAAQAQTIADAIGQDASSIAAPADQLTAAIALEGPAARGRAPAEPAEPTDASPPETSVVEAESALVRPVPPLSPEQLLPPSDAPAIEPGPRDPAPTAQPQAGPASTDDEAVMPAVTLGAGLPIDRQVPPQALESAAAAGDQDSAGAPALPAGLSPGTPGGATGRPEERRTASGVDQIAQAAEPQGAAAPAQGAADGDGGLRQEQPAAQDGPSASQARGTDPRPPPSGDLQPGPLSKAAGQQGNGVAGVHSAAGVSVEAAQVVGRTPDGAVSVPPGPPPAHQVALQITRALDQDRTEIRIKLDPPELGDVDIQLEFRDLRLTASVSAERPDTLELLQRDSRTLARALRDAGLELADSDLSFAHHGRHERPDAGSYAQRTVTLPAPLAPGAPLQELALALAGPAGFVSLSDGRMDLRV